MLGFDALGRLALGQTRHGDPVVNHTLTLTANVDVAATQTSTIQWVLSVVANVAGAAASRQAVAVRLTAVVAAAAFFQPAAIAQGAVALVAVTATTLKAVALAPLVASVAATATAVVNIAKALVARVSAFASMILEAQNIVSTRVLHKPVDYFMEGLPQYRALGSTYEPSRGTAGEKTTVTGSRRTRLSGSKPSFTTKTGKRGYD